MMCRWTFGRRADALPDRTDVKFVLLCAYAFLIKYRMMRTHIYLSTRFKIIHIMILRVSLLSLLFSLCVSAGFGQATHALASYNIIPAPVKIEPAAGDFVLRSTVKIVIAVPDKEVSDA